MMDRRRFLRRCSLIAAGVIAGDQVELLERLTHQKVWAGFAMTRRYDVTVNSAGSIRWTEWHQFNKRFVVGDQEAYVGYVDIIPGAGSVFVPHTPTNVLLR